MTDFLQMLNSWDTDLLLAINGQHNAFFDVFMYTYSGKWVWIPMYIALVYLLLRNLPRKSVLLCLVGVALAITFADQVGASIIRPWVERLRPSNPENPISDIVHIVNGYRGGRYGFPSCHAANTFALAFYLMLLIRHKGFTLFMMGWALLTCYSRAYLGVHYPGDLLAGTIVGLLGALLAFGLFRWVDNNRMPHRFEHLWVPVVAGGLTVAGMLLYSFVIFHV